MVPQQQQLSWGMFTSFASYRNNVSMQGWNFLGEETSAVHHPPCSPISVMLVNIKNIMYQLNGHTLNFIPRSKVHVRIILYSRVKLDLVY